MTETKNVKKKSKTKKAIVPGLLISAAAVSGVSYNDATQARKEADKLLVVVEESVRLNDEVMSNIGPYTDKLLSDYQECIVSLSVCKKQVLEDNAGEEDE